MIAILLALTLYLPTVAVILIALLVVYLLNH